VRSFNSLSRDHELERLVALGRLKKVDFQLPLSGSRGHHQQTLSTCRRSAANFQLPLSGSHSLRISFIVALAKTSFQLPLSGSLKEILAELQTKNATFNSLSRDHINAAEERGLYAEAFQLPLSGSHPRQLLAWPQTARPSRFQLPLSGSPDYISCSGARMSDISFQLPLSGSLIVSSLSFATGLSAFLSTPSLGIT